MSTGLILVVEDNPTNLKLVRDVLQFSGYEVIEATCGEDGVRLAKEEHPDLILMDLQLPGIDGMEALRQIRSNEDGAMSRGGGHGVRHERGPRPRLRSWLQRLRAQAHQRAPPATKGPRSPHGREWGMNQESTEKVTVLVVDDQPQNIRLLDAILTPRGYDVRTAASGEEALAALSTSEVDLVLLDILMPGMDGYEVCRRIREQNDTAYLPVVMVTASGDEQKIKALEAGADDFLAKPINQSELLARVKSLARIKRYQDTIKRQASELADWNRELESRVESQVSQLERMSKLRRFLSPQLAELIVDSGDETFLESHRREIVVVFCDLRGFTPFAESSEPEEVMGVLNEYHEALGDLVFRFEGTLERFTGDGLMVFFNDPVRCDDGPLRAIRMSVAMRTRVRDLAEGWGRQGHDLTLGIGLAQGYATLGTIGFEGRRDYAAIGSVTNLAARLCAEAEPWQILASERVVSAAGPSVVAADAGDRKITGFSREVHAYDIKGLDSARTMS